MDRYRAYELHFRFSKEVDELEKELETEKQNASQELQKAKDEIESRRLEERSMLQKRLGTIPLPPDLTQFIEDKRDFYLRQATQKYEERLENDRKRFIEKVSAVNEKWRMLPFDIENSSTPPTELPISRLSLDTKTPISMPSPMQNHPPQAQPAVKLPVSHLSNKRPITEIQSPNENIANEQPAKRPSAKRSITFDEVYQEGNAKFKHIIVEYPPESGEFYILKCDDHGVHFGANPLAGAAKHLASKMHDHQSKNYSVAIDTLGFRVIGCNAELAQRNNTAVEEAAVNGYKPVNLLQLSVGKRARYVEANPEFANSFSTPIPSLPLASPAAEALPPAMAPPPSRETATSPAMAPPSSRDTSTPSPAKDRRKSSHIRTPSDRSTRSAVLIPNPKPASLYKGFWVQDKRHYPVMVLPVKEADLSSVGLEKTLEDTKLLQTVPLCYKLDKTAGKIKFEGWAPGYEDGGPLVKLRQVPVMYFDRDMSFGWLSIKDISAFDFDDPDWRQIPYFQKAVEHWESLNKAEAGTTASSATTGGAEQPRLESNSAGATLPEPTRNPTAPAAAAAAASTDTVNTPIPPAVVRLAEIAKTDPQLRALIDRVGSKEGTKEENERLERIVDQIALELSSSGEAVAATVQLLQPKSVSSGPKNMKGHGTGLRSPESSKPPTPHLTKAAISPAAAAPAPLVTAGPTPDSSTASSRTTSPTEVPAPTSTSINNPHVKPPIVKPATFVKPENGVTATAKATQPQNQNEKFEVTIEKGSWNVDTNCPTEDKLSVRLIACNQTKIASTAPGLPYKNCPYKFEIDPNKFANVVVENCPSSPNAKTIVTIILKKGREGSGDRTVVLTFDRFVNPDTKTVESGRVQARRFCRWLRGVNTSIAYSNKSFQ
ncbi:hypothetical protein NEUTE1DRAFT_87492 [Neurospora tetrasperma FGSC 2508]|uniref:Uncharacterized protein n=1 Tax=Neurospora tetrasperma (strain FGSC 2508 / ATCC MYA-4615 / P0657) TaxID=510951 RepID=F8MX16_NEUT8|nr:uncharacterized protein NEUTE1DRAFT_87492 [Neurospora tetrasperma FGSC 2508]EGO54287.1 hypothetical protein NEUTE1DRAFT_87492 [Neurospora tetrasperma FGSC 2508]